MGKLGSFPVLPLISEGSVLRHNPEQQEAAAAAPNLLNLACPNFRKQVFKLPLRLSTTENFR